MSGALEGLRILDLSQFEAGPSATELLGFLGADVIKIEDPVRGDQGRSLGIGRNGSADSMYFQLLNLNKRSATLNLKDERGRDLLLEMLPRFDVLVENFALGTMERLGLSWETLRERHPGLIYASIRGFGDTGPYADYKAFDMAGQAAGGAMSVNGEADGPPMRLGITLGDTGTGVHLAVGILAAYIERERTGAGRRVEVSMQEAIMNFSRVAMLQQYFTNEPTPRRGNPLKYMTADLFACAGGGPNDYVYIVANGPVMWDGVLKTIDRTDLIGDEDWSSAIWRSNNFDEVRAIVEPWTSRHDKFDAMARLQANGVPCSAVFDTGDLLTDDHLRSRGMVADIDHPEVGSFEVPGNPVRIEGSSVGVTRAPLKGEHTTDVYAEVLGLAPADVDRLRSDGVVELRCLGGRTTP
jgi:formyl-CoA transferase